MRQSLRPLCGDHEPRAPGTGLMLAMGARDRPHVGVKKTAAADSVVRHAQHIGFNL